MRRISFALALIVIEANCSRSAQTYLARGNALYNAGKYADAELEYRACLAKNRGLAEGYYRLGLAEGQLGHADAALAAAQKAVALAPGNDDYQIALADLSVQALQYDPGARRSYDQLSQVSYDLLHKNPNSLDGLRLHAELLIIDRKYDDALAELRKVETIRPLDPRVIRPRVRALLALDRIEEAEREVTPALHAPGDGEATYQLVIDYDLSHDRAAEAERLLQSEIMARPTQVGPRIQLAEVYRSSGRHQEMSAVLDGIRRDGSRFAHAHASIGDFYAESGLWEDALREYQDGDRAEPAEKERYEKGIARAMAALGRTKDAIAELNLVLQTHTDDVQARLARAILLYDSASSADRELAIGDLKALAARAPEDASIRYELGLAYAANGNSKAAANELTKAADLQPDDPAVLVAQSELALDTGDYTAAVRLAELILAEDSENRDAALIEVRALIGLGNYSRAHAVLDGLLKAQPQSSDVNLVLASLDTAEQRYAKADEILARELRASPDSPNVHLLVALAAIEEGKPAAAIQQYEWLLARDPESVSVLKSLGELYTEEGDLPKAIATFKRLLALRPDDAEAMNNLAFDLAEKGIELDRALMLSTNAAQKLGDNPEVLDTLGWVYTKKGQNENALRVFRSVVKRGPDVAMYHYHFGVALLQNRQADQAKSEFAVALSKKPAPELAERIKRAELP
jgi:tetratricopeptide (TPR) repeat protein